MQSYLHLSVSLWSQKEQTFNHTIEGRFIMQTEIKSFRFCVSQIQVQVHDHEN